MLNKIWLSNTLSNVFFKKSIKCLKNARKVHNMTIFGLLSLSIDWYISLPIVQFTNLLTYTNLTWNYLFAHCTIYKPVEIWLEIIYVK